MAGYGTGAVMAVPCGDQRDFEFAKHFKSYRLKIFSEMLNIAEAAFSDKEKTVIANSDFLNGLSYVDATQKIIQHLGAIGDGRRCYYLSLARCGF